MAYSNKTTTKKEFINQALTKHNAGAWDMPEVELKKVNLAVKSVPVRRQEVKVEKTKEVKTTTKPVQQVQNKTRGIKIEQPKIPATAQEPVNSTQTPIKINLPLKGTLLDKFSLEYKKYEITDRGYPFGGEILLGDKELKIHEVEANVFVEAYSNGTESWGWKPDTDKLLVGLDSNAGLPRKLKSFNLVMRKSNDIPENNLTNNIVYDPLVNGDILYQTTITDRAHAWIPVTNIPPQFATIEVTYTAWDKELGNVVGKLAPIYLTDKEYYIGHEPVADILEEDYFYPFRGINVQLFKNINTCL